MNTFSNNIPFESAVELPRFHTKAGESRIDLTRIVYLNAQLNYTVFHLNDGEKIITSLPLSLYNTLLEKHGFMRLHKSHLLNLHYLPQCRVERFQQLVLPDKKVIPIARRRRNALKKTMQSNKS